MNTLILVFLFIILGALVALLVFLLNQQNQQQLTGNSLNLFQQQINSLQQQINDSINQLSNQTSGQLLKVIEQVNSQLNQVSSQLVNSQRSVGERLDNAARVVSAVSQELGKLQQASQQILELGKEIGSLQELLQAPKLRGGLGEFFLEEILAKILPRQHYETQYKFRSGETVDVVIKLVNGMVPVDSKFPLENFRKITELTDENEKKRARKKFTDDVRKHIEAIATKYILPDEGTLDFALMYIPAENVYYEIIVREENATEENSLLHYALQKKVVPVSPNTFYSYLQAIVLGLRGLQIEKNAKVIIEHLGRLKGDFQRFRQEFEVLGKHIKNISTKYDDAVKRLTQFEDKLVGGTGSQALPPEENLPELEKH